MGPKSSYQFGPFLLDAGGPLLFRQGQVVPLTPKALEILRLLLERHGGVVGKGDLLRTVWPDTFVEEANIAQNIATLRKALGPGYIDTVPKRGYRFVAEVAESGAEQAATTRRWAKWTALLAAGLLLAAAGWYLAGWQGREIRSVAVLPFLNLSPDRDTEYFADALTEELITALSRVGGLRVPARTSSFQFKGKAQDIRSIGRQLNVGAVVEGSVRPEKDRVRVTAQLNKVSDGYHLWSETYECDLKDLFAVQEHICRDVAAALKLPVSNPLVKRYTANLDAYLLYWKGRFYWNKRTLEGVERGIEYFNDVVAKDPGYALAYAGLADSYSVMGQYNVLPPRQAYPAARAAALKALRLDEGLAEAHASLAGVKAAYEWDRAGAERAYRRAIELNPSYPTAHQWYAEYLSVHARHREALAEIERAQELDPLSLIIGGVRGLTFYFAGQYDRALEECRRTLEIDPNFTMTPFFLGYIHVQQARYEDAIGDFQKGISLSGGYGAPYLAHTYAVMGRRGEALRILTQLRAQSAKRYISPYDIALIHMGLGEKEEAFAWLAKAVQDRSNWLLYLKVDPRWRPLRADPRFGSLLKQVGLE